MHGGQSMSKFGPTRTPVESPLRPVIILLQRAILGLARHWFLIANLISGSVLTLGFLAPALMAIGAEGAGQTIYSLLSPHSHQLPQRSYFLFGQADLLQTYSLEELIRYGADPDRLQMFVGNNAIGFKTALNHRMIAIFAAIFLGGIGWGLAGGRPRLGAVGFMLLLLPLLLDGFSHMNSENSGQGFRESNQWAVQLTGGLFSPDFYRGTTVGSLNWFLRTVTGLLFGLGLVWFLFTYFSIRFTAIRRQLEPKLRKIGVIQ